MAALDFDTILYLVFAIIGGLYSYFKKRNKEKEGKPETEGSAAPRKEASDPIEDFLKNLTGTSEPKKTEQKQKDKAPSRGAFNPQASNYESIDKAIDYEFKEDLVKPATHTQAIEHEEEKSTYASEHLIRYWVNGEEKNLTPRDLVIANVIFNRPYT